MAFLSLLALAVGCAGAQPTRNVIVTGASLPTLIPTPPATPASLSTAIPTLIVDPTPRSVTEDAPTPAPEPTVELGHQVEPTADPGAPATVPRQTIAPVPTATPQPTATIAVAALPTMTPTAPPPAASADLIIECVFFDGLVKTTEADEYVQILNQGSTAVDLIGWRLIDQADGSPEFAFPSFVLQPQASVRVYTNEEHPESGGFSFQRKSSIWNNSDPYTAALIDPSGAVVSTRSYPPGC